jgi:hypothetical protein
MKDNYGVLELIVIVVVLATSFLLGKIIFEAVMATDWPDWVKYLILK